MSLVNIHEKKVEKGAPISVDMREKIAVRTSAMTAVTTGDVRELEVGVIGHILLVHTMEILRLFGRDMNDAKSNASVGHSPKRGHNFTNIDAERALIGPLCDTQRHSTKKRQ